MRQCLKFMIPRHSKKCTNCKALNGELSVKTGGSRIFLAYEIAVGNEMNRPYSYSHGCTGNKHEREADAGKSFQMQITSPA